MKKFAFIGGESFGFTRGLVKDILTFDAFKDAEIALMDIDEEIDLKRGAEYASSIFNACFGDNTPFEFNGNVRNFGLISNLPEGCCVEVPVIACKNELKPKGSYTLPDHLAIMVN